MQKRIEHHEEKFAHRMDKKDPKEKAKEIMQSPGNSMLAKGDLSLAKAQENK